MIAFGPRAEPLAIAAVLAHGEAARTLAAKLRSRLPLPTLSAARADDAIVVIGEPLPWVEGAIWLGRAPDAPSLLIPTRLALTPHPALIAEALSQRGLAAPIALAPADARIVAISLAPARAPGAEALDAFLAERAP